ncbi:rhomboid family intramembrane serine protease [Balneolaceae bacterium ANBcel3]|nr:rhomboid family intramembrane serine protease [Balneolaceae bacterium ANBcel3]
MITLAIILFTVIVTVLAWSVFPSLQRKGMLVPYQSWREKRWYPLFTSGLLHADVTHLLVNMFVFFFFGLSLETEMGSGHFLFLYASALMMSSVPTLLLERNNPQYASIGASGAVEAVVFGYIVLFPLNKIYLLFIPIGIPAIIFGVLYLLYSYYEAKRKQGRVNHVAHISGAVYGALFVLLTVPDAISRFLNHFM